jgi:hypothetical protein
MNASRSRFLYQKYSSGKYKERFVFRQYSIQSVNKNTDGVYSGKSTVTKPDNLLHYITIHYFIFFGFLIFCTIRKQNVGKAYVVCAKVVRVRCVKKVSMERCVQLLNHVGWNDHMGGMSMGNGVYYSVM